MSSSVSFVLYTLVLFILFTIDIMVCYWWFYIRSHITEADAIEWNNRIDKIQQMSRSDFNTKVTDRVKELMEKNKLSRSDLARLTKWDKGYVTRCLNEGCWTIRAVLHLEETFGEDIVYVHSTGKKKELTY